MNKDEALNVAADFQNYLRKGDKTFIEKYTSTEIRCALSLIPHYPYESHKQWYKEMERRIAELDGSAKERKWYKNYLFDKIFPLVIAGAISFAVGYSLKFVEVKKLKADVQTLKIRESTIQAAIEKAHVSGNPSDLLDVWSRINRQSSVSEEDKRQFRTLVAKLDDLEQKLRVALAENDVTSVSVISADMKKTREKIQRLKDWGNVP